MPGSIVVVEKLTCVHSLAQPEVRQLHNALVASLLEDDVLRPHVTVHDLVLVQEGHGLAQLPHDPDLLL